MRYAAAIACALTTLAAGTIATSSPSPRSSLVVHEWGTFTSIAGEDGSAAEWLPQAGTSDLPAFVHRLPFNVKPSLPGTVRMETPVIYFYAPRETTARVRVRFRNGVVTEWFPRAAVTPSAVGRGALARPGFEGAIEWTNVHVGPRGSTDFPAEDRANHYYAARATDASPIERGSEREKFLFYRGVGHFAPPLAAVVEPDGSIRVASLQDAPLGALILLESRGGRVAYDLRHVHATTTTFAPALPAGDPDTLFASLEGLLVAEGLYPREARAMLETWRDSWFEEGTRLFYIVPREAIDTILPLDVEPAPADVSRVFVGRIELITAATLDEVGRAFARNDERTLQKYHRFLRHILTRLN